MELMRFLGLFLLSFSLLLPVGCNEPPGRGNPISESPIPNEDQSSPRDNVLSSFPDHPDPSVHYLVYLHGAILENKPKNPISPRFGPYRYREILDALTARGFRVVFEPRPARASVTRWAEHIAVELQRLIDAGVPASNLTVVGFSKGAVIAVLASGKIENEDINWVIEAGCGRWIERFPTVVPHGRILSIYDRTDTMAGSCSELFSRMSTQDRTDEIVLELDRGHGAFYSPDPAWMKPCVEWGGAPVSR